jgi:redox-sensitive bicupin YhaK (pirin superfamily)
MEKAILHILEGREKKITDTEVVRQPLPHKDFRFASPFILLHHLGPESILPDAQEYRIHPHPHRGFAPVTFMLSGEGYHKDNAGHSATVHAGDVQWMFAGKGLLHSEGPTREFLHKGGTFELLQLWVNVPAAHKWDPPSYQFVKGQDLPEVFRQEGVALRLASGRLDGQTGPMKTFTPIITAFGTVSAGRQLQISVTPGYWTLLYVAHGSVRVSGQEIAAGHLVVFDREQDTLSIQALADSVVLYLSAEPIDEPVAAKDNFVMNTQEEIEQAMSEYKNGVFGKLDY